MRSHLHAASAILLSLLCGANALLAQQSPAPDTLPRFVLEGVVVTTTRAPASRDRLPQKVDVVTAADLERTVANDLADVLKKNAALDVIQFPGLLSAVSIRGFRPQYASINPRTLILVDGRPAGASNLALLETASLERIEVLRGPASALYGSSAMGGVVNLITRRSSGAPAGGATFSYGSFATSRAEVAAGGAVGSRVDFDVSGSAFRQGSGYRTGSQRLLGGDSVVKVLAGGDEVRLAELVRDTLLAFSEYGHRSGSLRLGYAAATGWRVDARGDAFIATGVQNPGDVHASYDSRSLKDVERGSGEVALSGTAGAHSLLARAYVTRETADYFNTAEAPNFVSFRTPTLWRGFQLQDALSLGRHTLVFGVDGADASAESRRFTAEGVPGAPFSPNSAIRSTAGFGEGRFSLLADRLIATAGGRLDRVVFDVRETELLATHSPNRESHTVFNPSLGLLYHDPSGLRIRTSAGRAFVTPDAFNVAGYSELRAGPAAVNVTRGNPALRPENSLTWDAGVGVSRPRSGVEAEITYFHTRVRNRIVLETSPGAGLLTPAGDTIRSLATYLNVDEAEIRGLEGTLSYDLGAFAGFAYSFRAFANGTRILRAEEVNRGLATPIRNVADLTLNYGVEFDDLRRFASRLSGRYVGERTDSDFSDWMNPGTVTFPSFVVLDLSSDLRLAERYHLGLRVENLADENYYEVRGYPLPGRTIRLQLGVRF